MKAEFDAMPPEVVQEGTTLRLFFGFEPVQKQGQDEELLTKYEGYNVDVVDDHSYAGIVSAIIKHEYPDDKKDAILANRELVRDYPDHEKADRYMADYNAFQDWRIYAKEIAQGVIEELQ